MKICGISVWNLCHQRDRVVSLRNLNFFIDISFRNLVKLLINCLFFRQSPFLSYRYDTQEASLRLMVEQSESMNRKGITLIELLIVLVIIFIGAALMVPNISGWMYHYRLRSAARDVVSVMRTAQMKAVSSNSRYGVAFDTGTQEFRLYRDSGGLQPDGASNGLPTGITFNAVSFQVDGTLNKRFVGFLPDSTASEDGAIVLANTKGVQREVQVSKTTGRIKLD